MATGKKEESPKDLTKGKISITVRLDGETKRTLDLIARVRGGSFSQYIEKSAIEYIANNPFTKAEWELVKYLQVDQSKLKQLEAKHKEKVREFNKKIDEAQASKKK